MAVQLGGGSVTQAKIGWKFMWGGRGICYGKDSGRQRVQCVLGKSSQGQGKLLL